MSINMSVNSSEILLNGHMEEEELIYFAKMLSSITTAVCILGVIGNILCAVVFHKMRQTTKGVRLLKYLSIVDISLIVSVYFGIILRYFYLGHWDIIFYVLYPFAYLCAITIYTFEIYLTILIAVQRCVAVALPLKFARYMPQSRVNKALFVIAVCSIVFNIPHWVACKPHQYWNNYYNMTLLTVDDSSGFYASYGYSVYRKYLTLVFRCIIPMVILITCNIILVISRRRIPTVIGQSQARDSGDRMTVIVIIITVLSLIVHVSSSLVLTLEDHLPAMVMNYFDITQNLILCINSAVNFVVYFMLGKDFKRTFLSLLQKPDISHDS